jgi:hypothetical protein
MNEDEFGFVQTPEPLADEMVLSAFITRLSPGDGVLLPGAGHGRLAAALLRACSVRDAPVPDATFVERGAAHLNRLRDKLLVFLAPRKWLRISAAAPLRNLIRQYTVTPSQLVPSAAFPDWTVEPCITVIGGRNCTWGTWQPPNETELSFTNIHSRSLKPLLSRLGFSDSNINTEANEYLSKVRQYRQEMNRKEGGGKQTSPVDRPRDAAQQTSLTGW